MAKKSRTWRRQTKSKQESETTIPVSPTTRPASFRFLDLPAEIQTMVLSHKNIISRAVGGVQYIQGCHSDWGAAFCSRFRSCCGLCSPYISFSGCRCTNRNTYSRTCQCLPLGSSVLLVNKTIREEGLRIFYTRNTFKFVGCLTTVFEELC